ncbi:hypothetical protein JD82_00932 [Prauserella rugosa]|uniref:Uncharacterized protein n=1 Tax=Prauserella rugosa TaxID=43354 RepID=A0A660C684_9PSEU|nr:hypothetical protein JD82_00932 [Prauserella rugosa]
MHVSQRAATTAALSGVATLGMLGLYLIQGHWGYLVAAALWAAVCARWVVAAAGRHRRHRGDDPLPEPSAHSDAEHRVGDEEVDEQPGGVDQGRHERSGDHGRVDAEPLGQQRHGRADRGGPAADDDQ